MRGVWFGALGCAMYLAFGVACFNGLGIGFKDSGCVGNPREQN